MINNQKIILFTIILISAIFSQTNVIDSRQTAITRAIKEAGSSVVSINVEQNAMTYYSSDPFFHHFFPYYSTQPRKSSGSGVIISPDGYLLTNTHVVQVRNITKITATLSGGKPIFDSETFSAVIVMVMVTTLITPPLLAKFFPAISEES